VVGYQTRFETRVQTNPENYRLQSAILN